MKKLLLVLGFLPGLVAHAQPGIQNIQAIPTPELWLSQRSSYDALDKYTPGFFLIGLNAFDPAHLGAIFAGPYVARQAFFGVIVDDTLVSYTAPVNLAGLNGGDNWSTLYVVHHPYVSAFAWDLLTNANYSATTPLNGLNGGDNDGGLVAWNGAYVVDPCSASPGPNISAYKGAIVLTLNSGSVGFYNSIYFTVDGSTPNPSASLGDINAATSWPALGTYVYAGSFTLAGGGLLTLKAVQTSGGSSCTSAITSGTFLDFGQNWSNNVVANGGASPSSGNVAIVNNCGLQLNTNGLLEASLGAYPTPVSFNLFMPDNLIASITPQIYWKGNQPYVNHSFVSGDLTVNGLKGDASAKWLDTGVTPSTDLSVNSSALAVYAYTVTAGSGSTFDFGAYISGGHGTIVNSKRGSSGNAQSEIQSTDANGILVTSPGAGYYCGSRTSSSRADLFFANSGNAHASIGNNTATADATIANVTLGLYCLHSDFSGAFLFSDSRLSAAAIMADGYTSANSAKLYAVLQSVRTQLGGGFQ